MIKQTFLLLLSGFFPMTAAAEIHLLTSIRPLTLLARDLIAPGDRVEQLLASGSSPHHYQMRVSERKKIAEADLVLWIGPGLEAFLTGPLGQRSGGVLTLSDLESIHWPDSGNLHNHNHRSHGHSAGKNPGKNRVTDPHLWLDPGNLTVITHFVTVEMIRIAPENTAIYTENRDRLLASIEQTHQRIAKQLAPLSDKAFVVLHPAYSHFVHRYQLTQQHYLLATPEQSMAARHRYQLQKLRGIHCVFGETGQDQSIVKIIAGQIEAATAVLDPLGSALPGDASITDLLETLSNTIYQCLSQPQYNDHICLQESLINSEIPAAQGGAAIFNYVK